MPLCTILRGAPGSGKTTWALANRQTSTLCSADHYFTGPDGVYRFDASKIGLAHAACRERISWD